MTQEQVLLNIIDTAMAGNQFYVVWDPGQEVGSLRTTADLDSTKATVWPPTLFQWGDIRRPAHTLNTEEAIELVKSMWTMRLNEKQWGKWS